MLLALRRLFILRPLFTTAVVGFPLIALAAIGVVTIVALKAFVVIVLPIAVLTWLMYRVFGRG
ncbi:MAG: hypothetical protein NVS1B4_01300 [Gemmatimonadaceae bacterium]